MARAEKRESDLLPEPPRLRTKVAPDAPTIFAKGMSLPRRLTFLSLPLHPSEFARSSAWSTSTALPFTFAGKPKRLPVAERLFG